MWVAELACVHGHAFEGWFGSRDDYESQQQRGLVSCPQCGSSQIERRLSAPRLNMGATPDATDTAPTPKSSPSMVSKATPAAALQELMALVHARTEDVGSEFAAEARRIHAQESPDRAIRGQATGLELEALADEGIEVMALPLLDSLPARH